MVHFQTCFYDYDVTALEIIHSIISRNYIKHLIKVFFEIKITSCKHATLL